MIKIMKSVATKVALLIWLLIFWHENNFQAMVLKRNIENIKFFEAFNQKVLEHIKMLISILILTMKFINCHYTI